MKIDVTALGELLVDFTQKDKNEHGNSVFEAKPGGAPANVLAMLSKLGRTTQYIGKVGDDNFGQMLTSVLHDAGIGTKGLVVDRRYHTTLSFENTGEQGERSLCFYRNPGADMMLDVDDLEISLIENTKIFHFGSLSMTHEEVRAATRYAVKRAASGGALISFDPNLRPALWRDLDDAKAHICWGLEHCHILKISDNELHFITGKHNVADGINILKGRYPEIELFLVTQGKQGSVTFYKDKQIECPSYDVASIETTGAGDTFFGCCLDYIVQYGLSDLTEDNLTQMLRFASAAAAIITTRHGTLCSVPTHDEVKQLAGDYEK